MSFSVNIKGFLDKMTFKINEKIDKVF